MLKPIRQFINESKSLGTFDASVMPIGKNIDIAKQFVNESLKSDILKKMMASGDAYTKAEIQSMANWDKSKGFALSEITDSQLVTITYDHNAHSVAWDEKQTAMYNAPKAYKMLTDKQPDIKQNSATVEFMFIDSTYTLFAKWGYNGRKWWLISKRPGIKILSNRDYVSMDTRSMGDAMKVNTTIIAYAPSKLATRESVAAQR